MIKLRTLIPSTVLVLLSFPLSPTFAGDIVILKSVDIPPYREAVKGFKSKVNGKVKEYVVGKNMQSSTVSKRVFAQSRSDIRQSKIIFTLGTGALRLAKDEAGDTPIVFTFVLNPEAVLEKMGANLSKVRGIRMSIPPERQFSILSKVAPTVKRIGIVYDPSKTQRLINETRVIAQRIGVTLVAREIRHKGAAIDAISWMKGKVDALWMVPDTTAITHESIEYMLIFSFRNSCKQES